MDSHSKDIYCFDSTTALEEAKKRKRVGTSNPHVDGLQICYYDGELIPHAPENCINVPIGNFYEYFLTTKNRLPEQIHFGNKEYSSEVKNELVSVIKQTLQSIVKERDALTRVLMNDAKQAEPDFSAPLKVFLIASRETTVMQYISQNIADAFKKLGYEVFLSIEENDMQKIDTFLHLVHYVQFKPNIIININHLNNSFLHENVFNFIWFQDYMPILQNNQPIALRQRDVVYSLVPTIDLLLEKKAVPFSRQSFCVNQTLFKPDETVRRENKIIFIGSSYAPQLMAQHDHIPLLKEAVDILNAGKEFTKKIIHKWAKKYGFTVEYIQNHVLGYIVRDMTVLWLDKIHQQTGLPVEIYGWGWERYDVLKPYYKGSVSYNQVASLYNSAKYALVPQNIYVLQQRTLEAAACGCQPIVYDCRYNDTPPFYEESLEYFRTVDDIIRIIEKDSTKDLASIVDENSYEHLAGRIISTVKEQLKNG
ncbi:MAG: glycosyltransferase [Sulfuricurvum sp.]|nr:glycosyltransferase [Sulfuricurvum sp.]